MAGRSLPSVCFQKGPRVKKAKPVTEAVTQCDHCGAPLSRSCARTPQSAICAAGAGVPFRIRGEAIRFYCSWLCENAEA